jgi:alanine-synthesizing transaminase
VCTCPAIGARYPQPMEFRRINGMPPYVFTIIDGLKVEARRAGEDVIDLGFGNPDLASPDTAVKKLAEAVENPRNHRYSASRGIPKLRLAITDLYRRKFGVELDPETQACSTIGAKEGFSHLMWVLLGPGDAARAPASCDHRVVCLSPSCIRRSLAGSPNRSPRRLRHRSAAGHPSVKAAIR